MSSLEEDTSKMLRSDCSVLTLKSYLLSEGILDAQPFEDDDETMDKVLNYFVLDPLYCDNRHPMKDEGLLPVHGPRWALVWMCSIDIPTLKHIVISTQALLRANYNQMVRFWLLMFGVQILKERENEDVVCEIIVPVLAGQCDLVAHFASVRL